MKSALKNVSSQELKKSLEVKRSAPFIIWLAAWLRRITDIPCKVKPYIVADNTATKLRRKSVVFLLVEMNGIGKVTTSTTKAIQKNISAGLLELFPLPAKAEVKLGKNNPL